MPAARRASPPGPRPQAAHARAAAPGRAAEGRGVAPDRSDRAPYDPALVAARRRRPRARRSAPRGRGLRLAEVRLPLVSPGRRPGGMIGPDLSTAGTCLKPEEIVESVLWPRRQVKEGYAAYTVATTDGKIRQGYKLAETPTEIVFRDPASARSVPDRQERHRGDPPGRDADARRADGRDVAGRAPRPGPVPARPRAGPAAPRPTPCAGIRTRRPSSPTIAPRSTPNSGRTGNIPVNRDRIYEFYAKEAAYFSKQPSVPALLPPFPGLDGGKHGHWGNQNEETWADGRWNQTDLGTVLCGVFRGAGVTVPKGVCVRLGDRGELAACFNPETLCYEALWSGGFVKFSATRHGCMDGLIMDGTPLPRPDGHEARQAVRLSRVLPARQAGRLRLSDRRRRAARRPVGRGRPVHPGRRAGRPSIRSRTDARRRPAQWPQVLDDQGHARARRLLALRGRHDRAAVREPVERPALLRRPRLLPRRHGHALHDPGGRLARRGARRDARERALAAVRLGAAPGARAWSSPRARSMCSAATRSPGCTTRMATARPTSTSASATPIRPRRPATISSAASSATPPGRFYTASGKQGLLRIAADGRSVEVVATGFRNPDGLGLAPDGTITVPNSEGEWVPDVDDLRGPPGRPLRLSRAQERPAARPAAGLPAARAGQFQRCPGHGPRRPVRPACRASCSTSPSARARISWCLREKVDGQPRGRPCRCPASSSRARTGAGSIPRTASSMSPGWPAGARTRPPTAAFSACATPASRSSCRLAFHAHENGVLADASPGRSTERSPSRPKRHFAQAWNYRYSASYGSPELSPRHPGQPGHDVLAIRSAHVLADGRTLFLEIPELQPVNQLHLHVTPGRGRADRPVRDGPPAGGAVHRVPGLSPVAQDDRRPPDPRRHGGSDAPARRRTPGCASCRAPAPSRSRPART